MRITSISITNLAAFTDFSVNLPAVGLLEGAHGVGKSSLERILCYAFGLRPLAEKGQKAIMHDPTILHGSAESGSAVLTFDEGPLESLRVRVSADKTERTIKVRGKKAWELAGQQVYDITNALSYNPLQFRDLAPKERLEAFLKVVPVEISTEEILSAVGNVIPVQIDRPTLDYINEVFDDIYKQRTACNTAADTQSKHAAQLEQAVGPVAPTGNWDEELKRLRGDKETLDVSERQEIARIGRELATAKDECSTKHRGRHAKIDQEINLKIGEFKTQIRAFEMLISDMESKRSAEKAEDERAEAEWVLVLRNNANAEVTELRTANAPLHSKLTTDIATAEERARKAAQDEGTRAAAVSARAEADVYAGKSKAMTEALDRLKDLKAAVAGRMAIKGYEIAAPRPGLPVDLCRMEDGALISFSNWNDASKDELCLKLAVMYRGTCGLVMIDSMANWSPARREQILNTCRKYAKEHGMQWLLGIATDSGELRVTDVTEVGK